MVGLVHPTSGAIRFRGRDVSELPRREATALQMVFQNPYGSLDPRMTVGESVAEPLRANGVGNRAERRERVASLLEVVGLPRDYVSRYPAELSGGQRQRIGIARALSLNPALVVADEAVSALDVSVQAQIVNLFADVQDEFRLTYLFISHDLSVVRHVSHRVVVLYAGHVMEEGLAETIFSSSVHPYTVALLSATPTIDPSVARSGERIVLPGDPASPALPPSGCVFHPRCWLRRELGNPERCSTERPSLSSRGGSHALACHFADACADSPTRTMVLDVESSVSPA